MPLRQFLAPSDFDFGSDDQINGYYDEMRSTIWSLKCDTMITTAGNTKPVTYSATGVCIDSMGFILTAFHFVRDCKGAPIQGRVHGGIWQPMVVFNQQQEKCDIALLRVVADNVDFDFAEIAGKRGNREIRVGHRVLGIGNPRNLLFTGGVGYVAKPSPPTNFNPRDGDVYDGVLTTAKNVSSRLWEKDSLDPNLILITVADLEWEGGSSGAPLYNRFGEIIGINVIANPSHSFFAHIGFIRSLIQTLEVHKAQLLLA